MSDINPHGPLHKSALKHSEKNRRELNDPKGMIEHYAVFDETGLVITGVTLNHSAAVSKVVDKHNPGWGIAVYINGEMIATQDHDMCKADHEQRKRLAA